MIADRAVGSARPVFIIAEIGINHNGDIDLAKKLIDGAVFGIKSLERHITLDRSMYGSDQAASVEVMGFHRFVSYVCTL